MACCKELGGLGSAIVPVLAATFLGPMAGAALGAPAGSVAASAITGAVGGAAAGAMAGGGLSSVLKGAVLGGAGGAVGGFLTNAATGAVAKIMPAASNPTVAQIAANTGLDATQVGAMVSAAPHASMSQISNLAAAGYDAQTLAALTPAQLTTAVQTVSSGGSALSAADLTSKALAQSQGAPNWVTAAGAILPTLANAISPTPTPAPNTTTTSKQYSPAEQRVIDFQRTEAERVYRAAVAAEIKNGNPAAAVAPQSQDTLEAQARLRAYATGQPYVAPTMPTTQTATPNSFAAMTTPSGLPAQTWVDPNAIKKPTNGIPPGTSTPLPAAPTIAAPPVPAVAGGPAAAGSAPYLIKQMQDAQTYGLTGAMDVANNPYLASSIKAAITPMQQSFTDAGGTLQNIRSDSLQSGQYGGTRQGLGEGIAVGRFNQTVGDVASKMSSDAYMKGQDTFAKTLSLAPSVLAAGEQPSQMLSAIGTQNEQYQQEVNNAASAAKTWDINKGSAPLANFTSLTTGLANPSSTVTAPPTPAPRKNLVGDAISGALLANNIWGQLNAPAK